MVLVPAWSPFGGLEHTWVGLRFPNDRGSAGSVVVSSASFVQSDVSSSNSTQTPGVTASSLALVPKKPRRRYVHAAAIAVTAAFITGWSARGIGPDVSQR